MGDVLKTGCLKYLQKKIIKSSWDEKFFALVTKTKRGICLIGFQNKGIFERYEAEMQNSDASKFEKCTKTYSQIVISDIKCLHKVSLKDQDAIETMTDSGKKYLLLADQEGNNRADSWVKAYQFELSQNTDASIGSARGPPDQWSLNENDLYESKDEGVSFEVEIKETDASNHLKLYGMYNLQVNSRNIALINQATKRPLYVWPLKYLRRYGRIPGEFSFDAGRRCESGEGIFKLSTLKGNEIFDIIEGMATIIREKERQSNSGGSSQGRSPPPVSNLPRPSSHLRKNFQQKQSLTFDAGAGEDSAHNGSTYVYTQPVKMTGRQGSQKKKGDLNRQISAPLLDPNSAYHLAAESSSPPGQNDHNVDCTYSNVEKRAPKAPPVQAVSGPYENIKAGSRGVSYENVDVRPPVPPKLIDSPSDRGSRKSAMSEKLKVEKMEHPEDDADYDEPDYSLGEAAYAYASVEDIKRDMPWMKKPEPGEVKFRIESNDDDDTDYLE